jgi:hypothetical protein
MDVSVWVRFTATERRKRGAAHRVLIEPSLDDPIKGRELSGLPSSL